MTPEQIIPKIEGLLGYMLGSADGGSIQGNQIVADWVTMVKALLSTSNFRYLTDLEFKPFLDLDEGATGADDEANEATHFIAALVEMTSTIATDSEGRVFFADSDALTVGTANPLVLTDDHFLMITLNNVTTTGVSQFYPILNWAGNSDDGTYSTQGINLATGLAAGCGGQSGGVPAANAVRAWILYRE